MRSLVTWLFLVFASVCCISCQTTKDPEATWSPREGYEHLIVAKRFSFGGVGYAGVTSRGEFAFRAILRGRDRAELFKAALSQATEAGKLYALCGIRVTDRSAFEKHASTLLASDVEVTTQTGCMIHHEKVQEVAKRIADGVYDPDLATEAQRKD